MLAVPAFAIRPELQKFHWSVIKDPSRIDSLKQESKSARGSIAVFRKLVATLELRESFRTEPVMTGVYPSSAGVFKGRLQPDSLSAFYQQLQLLRSFDDRDGEADHLNSYGVYHAVNGNFAKGIDLLKQAALIREDMHDKRGMLKNLLYQARIQQFYGLPGDAQKSIQKVMDLATELRDMPSLAESYIISASLLREKKDFKSAEKLLLSKALPLTYYKIKDQNRTIRCFEQLATIYQEQGRYSESKWFHIQANSLARTAQNTSAVVNSLINLGRVKMLIGDTDLALRDYLEAEKLSEGNGYHRQLIFVKAEISTAYEKLGKMVESELAKSQFITLQEFMLKKI